MSSVCMEKALCSLVINVYFFYIITNTISILIKKNGHIKNSSEHIHKEERAEYM